MPGKWKKQYYRYRPLERAMKIYIALTRTSVGLSVETLMEIGGVSKRTVLRYLDALENAGANIVCLEGDHCRILRMIRT